MNVLLISTTPKKTQKIIRDIINEFIGHGHKVFVVCPADQENPVSDGFVCIDYVNYLFINSRNSVGKVNIIKKGWNFIRTDSVYKQAIVSAISGIHVDLILYSTPPITLVNTILWVKDHFHAKTYLMLKDIFPQNAVDMGMMKKSGVMGIIYQYFRRKENKLYRLSDYIGCMSPANCRYILAHNPGLRNDRVGLCVNSYVEEPVRTVDADGVREKYGLPRDKVVFLYGGNLGVPQGLSYFVEVLKANQSKDDRFFMICGGGNDQGRITRYIEENHPQNIKFISSIPPDDFDELTRACDVGLVFLDYRFTIPNFPSRMLSIMLNQKPILAATDTATDVGEVIADGDMGWWCESKDPKDFCDLLDEVCAKRDLIEEKGLNARKYYESHYTTEIAYRQIIAGLASFDERWSGEIQ